MKVRHKPYAAISSLFRGFITAIVAAIILVANIVSFGALMFPGDLSAGLPTAIWAMLAGASIGGIWIAVTTSLPPIATGIDSPTGAFLVMLSTATGASALRAGATQSAAVDTILLTFT